MKKQAIVWISAAMMTMMSACSGGNTGNTDNSGTNGGQTTENFVVLAANDLGMHCIDREFSVFSILPPFNVVHAQVVGHDTYGNPVILDDADVSVTYDATIDEAASINSYSIGKTDFWDYADRLYSTSLAEGEGLTGLYMPQDSPTPGAQAFDYDTTYEWFTADGIPITPKDDALVDNPYPLMRISADDASSGSTLGYTDVVVPVAAETDCRSCHATGEIGASGMGIIWATDTDVEVQSKKNILRLHDALESTNLSHSTPVLCAHCHYSRALDLNGVGPTAAQVGKTNFSRAIHNYHGKILTDSASKLLPDDISSCYKCHPGQTTQCLRGAMATGGMDCIDCHGGMLAVGAEYNLKVNGSIDGKNDGFPRRPWQDLPRCQSCHTGDAVEYLTGTGLVVQDSAYPFRLAQAYKTNDYAASPLLASNTRFAENANTLYRFSKGHGGILCEGCHGSPHAIWPNQTADANDNVAANEIQGYPGKIMECTACHINDTLGLTMDGPHGLHNVNDSRWVNGKHGNYYNNDPTSCQRCHGRDLLGTPLSKVATARTFNVDDANDLAKGELVSCNRCHSMPD